MTKEEGQIRITIVDYQIEEKLFQEIIMVDRMNEKAFSKYFKAFGDRTRLRILKLLSNKEMTVNEIVDMVGLSQSTVSRHLSVLREAGIAVDRRDGQKVYYSLKKQAVENCCSCFCDRLEIEVKKKKK